MDFALPGTLTPPLSAASPGADLFVSCDMLEVEHGTPDLLSLEDAASVLSTPETNLLSPGHSGILTPVTEAEFLESEICQLLQEDKAPEEARATPARRGVKRKRVSKPRPLTKELTDTLVDHFFEHCHGKPYQVVNEREFRDEVKHKTVATPLLSAVLAVSCQYMTQQVDSEPSLKMRLKLAEDARGVLDLHKPSIQTLQVCLLLVILYSSVGDGQTAYSLLVQAVGMVFMLELHRETRDATLTGDDIEIRRQLFWTCYLLDRLITCDSHRPHLICDEVVRLEKSRGPVGLKSLGLKTLHHGSHPALMMGIKRPSTNSRTLLVDIARILGTANLYLACGGVDGDSEYPWNPLSKLSLLEQSLDAWVTKTGDRYSSLASLLENDDSSILVLSKLIYHTIYCIIYRPFLPITLAELGKQGLYQAWQLKATHICFQHANALIEMADIASTAGLEMPAFVGYCVAVAATVHIHGEHYTSSDTEGMLDAYYLAGLVEDSFERLGREMRQLRALQDVFPAAKQQHKTVECIRRAHRTLVSDIACCSIQKGTTFYLRYFYERYSHTSRAGAEHLSFDLGR